MPQSAIPVAQQRHAPGCYARIPFVANNAITYAGQLTADDYIAANKLHMQKRGWKRVAWMAIWFVLGLGAVLSADIAVQDPSAGLPPLLIILSIVGLQLFLRIIYLPRRARHIFSQQRSLQLPFESVVTDTGLESTNANGKTQLPWGHLIRWKEGDTLFVVYQSDLVFNMVPKRCFARPDHVAEFRAIVTERLGPSA